MSMSRNRQSQGQYQVDQTDSFVDPEVDITYCRNQKPAQIDYEQNTRSRSRPPQCQPQDQRQPRRSCQQENYYDPRDEADYGYMKRPPSRKELEPYVKVKCKNIRDDPTQQGHRTHQSRNLAGQRQYPEPSAAANGNGRLSPTYSMVSYCPFVGKCGFFPIVFDQLRMIQGSGPNDICCEATGGKVACDDRNVTTQPQPRCRKSRRSRGATGRPCQTAAEAYQPVPSHNINSHAYCQTSVQQMGSPPPPQNYNAYCQTSVQHIAPPPPPCQTRPQTAMAAVQTQNPSVTDFCEEEIVEEICPPPPCESVQESVQDIAPEEECPPPVPEQQKSEAQVRPDMCPPCPPCSGVQDRKMTVDDLSITKGPDPDTFRNRGGKGVDPGAESIFDEREIETKEVDLSVVKGESQAQFQVKHELHSGISGLRVLAEARSKQFGGGTSEPKDFVDYFVQHDGCKYIGILEQLYVKYTDKVQTELQSPMMSPQAKAQAEEAQLHITEFYKIVQVELEKQLQDYEFPIVLENDISKFRVEFLNKVANIGKLHNYGVKMILYWLRLLETKKKPIDPTKICQVATELMAEIMVLCYSMFVRIAEFLARMADDASAAEVHKYTLEFLTTAFRNLVDCICDEMGAIGESCGQVMIRIPNLTRQEVVEVMTNLYTQINYADVSISRAAEAMTPIIQLYHLRYFLLERKPTRGH